MIAITGSMCIHERRGTHGYESNLKLLLSRANLSRGASSGMSQRVVVTGGAGFLGSHLCGALLGEGHGVVAVDNLLTGRARNLDHLRNEKRFEFLQADICEP